MQDEEKEPSKEGVLRRIYEGIDTPFALPIALYLFTAKRLTNAVDKGWGKLTFAYNSPDYKLYESISDHIYLFSGAKTFQQTLAMSKEIVKDHRTVSFPEFKESAGKIFDQYNVHWLESEYVTAITGASAAKNWNKIQREKETFPYLTWITSGDETVCRICGGFDQLTLRATDPHWRKYWPPLHFRCNCHVQQHDEESRGPLTSPEEFSALEQRIKPYYNQTFHTNTGITGQIFTEGHPYFQIPKQYRKLAMRNFDLPIPENHSLLKWQQRIASTSKKP